MAWRTACLGLLALCLLAGDPATEVIVQVSSYRFDPARIEVPRGTRVSFHRRDPAPETYVIQAVDGSFESWPLENYTQWSYLFDRRGEFEFFLREHPKVRGRILVR